MAITINGTAVSTNRLNSSNITLESLNGAKLFPLINHIWVYLWDDSSEPPVGLPFVNGTLGDLYVAYPPNNYPIGTMAAIFGGSYWRVYQIQEG